MKDSLETIITEIKTKSKDLDTWYTLIAQKQSDVFVSNETIQELSLIEMALEFHPELAEDTYPKES
jgi:hypothetical protein